MSPLSYLLVQFNMYNYCTRLQTLANNINCICYRMTDRANTRQEEYFISFVILPKSSCSSLIWFPCFCVHFNLAFLASDYMHLRLDYQQWVDLVMLSRIDPVFP